MFKLPLFKDIHICSLLCVTSNIKFTTALNIKETHSFMLPDNLILHEQNDERGDRRR